MAALSDDEQRRPADKAFAIFVTLLLILAMVVTVFAISGLKTAEGQHSVTNVADLGGFLWYGTAAGALCLFAAFWGAVGGLSTGKPSQWWETHFLKPAGEDLKDSRPASVVLVVATVLANTSVLSLALATGGAVGSPFGQLPLGFVLLAPLIMTSGKARAGNMLLGTAIVVVLHGHPSFFTSLPIPGLEEMDAAPGLADGWNFGIVAMFLAIGSLGFPEIARRFRPKKVRAAQPGPSITDETRPSGSELNGHDSGQS